eukprot:comp23278_c1_seq1/m.38123 comp23278_c1_seq1/g.38123  ORF comp23278_c1_seq1/g.38123 comp23278_c1_seq1/m.38123 type:complete len:448 (-) comp23278_c1_seq1:123-1466(-)
MSDPLKFTDVDIDDPFGARTGPSRSPPRSSSGVASTKTETKPATAVLEPETEEDDAPPDSGFSTPSRPPATVGHGSEGVSMDQKLFFAVSDPVLQDSKLMDKHYDYLVESRKSASGPVEASCRRRYNHFEWLHTRLTQSRPDLIVPPMPGKTLVTVGSDKLEPRRAGLEQFLNRIGQHHELWKLPEVDTFMNGDAASLTSKSSLPHFDISKGVKSIDKKYVDAMDAAQRLEKCLVNIDKQNQKLSKLRYDMTEDVVQLSHTLDKLEGLQPELAGAVTATRRALEDGAEVQQKTVLKEATDYENSIRELAAYCQSVVAMLNYRTSVQKNLENLEAALEKTNSDRDALESGQNKLRLGQLMGKDVNQLKGEKIGGLTSKLNELNEQRDDAIRDLERVNAAVDTEIEWWDLFRRRELKRIFTAYAQQNIEHIKAQRETYTKYVAQAESSS